MTILDYNLLYLRRFILVDIITAFNIEKVDKLKCSNKIEIFSLNIHDLLPTGV